MSGVEDVHVRDRVLSIISSERDFAAFVALSSPVFTDLSKPEEIDDRRIMTSNNNIMYVIRACPMVSWQSGGRGGGDSADRKFRN